MPQTPRENRFASFSIEFLISSIFSIIFGTCLEDNREVDWLHARMVPYQCLFSGVKVH